MNNWGEKVSFIWSIKEICATTTSGINTMRSFFRRGILHQAVAGDREFIIERCFAHHSIAVALTASSFNRPVTDGSSRVVR